ncbi:MAG: alpha/beta fold hydrolase [Gaiellaceae bacterium]
MTERAFYLESSGESCFSLFRGGRSDRAAVLLLPLFGWEELSSHRSLRTWAERLSEHGHSVLRFDLPGTGDSARGPADGDRWEAWSHAAVAAARWLRVASGSPVVAAVGVGLGGLLAYEVVAQGCAEELILWGSASRGKPLLRAMRAFSALETAQMVESGAPPPPPLPAGTLAPGGFLLSRETVEAIDRYDISGRPLPAHVRALVLDRDGVEIDGSLSDVLTAAGAQVTTAPGPGIAAMLVEPDQSRPPSAAFDLVQAWLDGGDRNVSGTVPSDEGMTPSEVLALGDFEERPLTVVRPFGELAGVFAAPVNAEPAPFTVVFLNAGAIRRIGPHRIWVDAARRWATLGIPSLRVDLQGIGDSDGDAELLADVARFHDEDFVEDVHAVLDQLESSGLGRRFVLLGLCSGAFWAFQAIVSDERVDAAVMVNPRVLYWDEQIEVARDLRRARLLRHPVTWKRLARGEVSWRRWRAFARWVIGYPARSLRRFTSTHGPQSVEARIARAYDVLRDRDQQLRFIFCDGEPLRDELTPNFLSQPSRWGNVSVTNLPGRDHTLRPLWMHEHVDAALDGALRAQLAIASEGRQTSSSPDELTGPS